jgi:pyruvate/2-oxoglutarate dehydrogenase complex dihydrolipoamide dehydrogenase (E3) component
MKMVERGSYNWACILTKPLLRSAEVVSLLGQGREFGLSVTDFSNCTYHTLFSHPAMPQIIGPGVRGEGI